MNFLCCRHYFFTVCISVPIYIKVSSSFFTLYLPSGTIEWRWKKLCLDCGYTGNEGAGAFWIALRCLLSVFFTTCLTLDSLHVIRARTCMLLVALVPMCEHGTVFGAVVRTLNVSAPYWAQASAVKRASISSGNVVTYGKHRLYGHPWGWW